mgnify:CR=1 FL=1
MGGLLFVSTMVFGWIAANVIFEVGSALVSSAVIDALGPGIQTIFFSFIVASLS